VPDNFPYYFSTNPAELDTLVSLDRMFRLAADHPIVQSWRFHADTCYKFEYGDQWTQEEKGVLKDRNQPEIVENEIRPTIERLQGQFRKQRTTIKFLGRNPSDEQAAQGNSDLLRHIDYVNQYEFVEGEAVKDQLIGGLGWIEVIVQPNALGQPQVRYRKEDPFSMFPDPFCRSYDLNQEARYVCRAKWFDEDVAVQLWGEEKAAKIRQVLGTSQPSLANLSNIDPSSMQLRNWEIGRYYDTKNRRFRPVEIWYKQRETEFLITMADGTVKPVRKERGVSETKLNDALAQMPGATYETRSVDSMWCAVYCGGLFLDGPKRSPYKHDLFPFVPYYCYRKNDGEPQGYVWGLIDPQREINARRSKALWALNNRQTIFERNAIRDKTELAVEMAKMDGQIEVENGKFDKFAVKENQDISQGNLTMLQETKLSIRRISGEDQMNPAPEVRSGTGIQRLQMIYQAGVLPIADNIRRSRRMKAALTFELVKQFYTEEMVFQITEDPGMVKTVKLTADHFDTLKTAIYDLVAEDTVDHSTSQAEQFETLATTLPQALAHGPQWAKLFIQMSDLKNKETLVKMIDQMSAPPPTQAKPSVAIQWNELTPQEKAAFAKLFQWQDLMQVEAQTPGEPASLTQNKAELLKMKMKTDAEVQAAMIRAGTAHHQQRVDLETAGMQHVANLRQQQAEQDAEKQAQAAQQAHEQQMQQRELAAQPAAGGD
jgi:hypothetical protein